jgi:succinate dehydrogenase/fumarate reductase cytochrome b subunit
MRYVPNVLNLSCARFNIEYYLSILHAVCGWINPALDGSILHAAHFNGSSVLPSDDTGNLPCLHPIIISILFHSTYIYIYIYYASNL